MPLLSCLTLIIHICIEGRKEGVRDGGMMAPAASFPFIRKAKALSEGPTIFPLCLVGQN